jgi:hypothetical protein
MQPKQSQYIADYTNGILSYITSDNPGRYMTSHAYARLGGVDVGEVEDRLSGLKEIKPSKVVDVNAPHPIWRRLIPESIWVPWLIRDNPDCLSSLQRLGIIQTSHTAIKAKAPARRSSKRVTAQVEAQAQADLAACLDGAKLEVSTPVGRIDILTNDEVIEVKRYASWKHALGQAIAYSVFYPALRPRIHLVGRVGKEERMTIEYVCRVAGVTVSFAVG